MPQTTAVEVVGFRVPTLAVLLVQLQEFVWYRNLVSSSNIKGTVQRPVAPYSFVHFVRVCILGLIIVDSLQLVVAIIPLAVHGHIIFFISYFVTIRD